MKLINELLNIDLPNIAKQFKSKEVIGGVVKAPIVIRLDGVRFGKKLVAFNKPRDVRVHRALIESSKQLMIWFNADLAYVVSDEINLVILNYVPYGGRVFKLVSISASIASTCTSLKLLLPLYFDSRVIQLNSKDDVLRYLLYRARVGLNNYVSSIYHNLNLGNKEVTPNTKFMIQELTSKGVLKEICGWEALGSCVLWRFREKKVTSPITKEEVIIKRRYLSIESFSRCVKFVRELMRD